MMRFPLLIFIRLLGVYGFVFLPSGWRSFKQGPNEPPKDPELIRKWVGNYSYLALILVLVMRFCSKAGVDVMSTMYTGEVYPFKYVFKLQCFLAINLDILTYLYQITFISLWHFISNPFRIGCRCIENILQYGKMAFSAWGYPLLWYHQFDWVFLTFNQKYLHGSNRTF